MKLQQIFFMGRIYNQNKKKTLLLHLYSCIAEAQKMRGDAEPTNDQQTNGKRITNDQQTNNKRPTKNRPIYPS